jgi:hypothetical protein
MRYMQTLPREPSGAAASADELAAMRPEMIELGGTERVDDRSSRARDALVIGLLTALVSIGLGGRYLAAEPEPQRQAASPQAPTAVERDATAVDRDAVAVTLIAPVEDAVIRGNVVRVRAQASVETVEIWVVGRVGRLMLGEVRATARGGVITADLSVVTPPEAPVTTLDLVIETRDGGRSTTLATRRVVVATRSSVALASVQLESADGVSRLELVGTAPVGTAVEASVKLSSDPAAAVAEDLGTCLATFDDTALPFGLGHWVCRLPMDARSLHLTIDVRWVSPTGQAGSILLTRVGSDLDAGREGS